MKTPRHPEALRVLAGWLAAAAMGLAMPPAHAIDLPGVMALLARHKAGEAQFTEERFVSGFDTPLRSKGMLSFAAPDRFTRSTTEPRAESMEVQGDTLTLRRSGRTRTLSVDSVPELAALIGAVRGTLNGDAQALQRHFALSVSGEPGKWVMVMTPTDRKLAQQVMSIEIVGQASELRSIALQMHGGDRSLMLVEPLKVLPAPAIPAPLK